MGLVGRWIDQKVAEHPDAMLRVAKRQWGNLSLYISGKNRCGCLVGSAMLEGAVESYGEVPLHLCDSMIGGRVPYLCNSGSSTYVRERSQGEVITLLKRRIWRSLRRQYPERFTSRKELHAHAPTAT